MRIRRVDVVPYGGAVQGVGGGALGWAERHGLLLRLVDAEGRVAQGEASPLPRYSPDAIRDAAAALARLDWTTIPDADPGEPALAYLGRVAGALTGLGPASRFAAETALLDRLGQERRSPIWALLRGAGSCDSVPLSYFAGGAEDPQTVQRAQDAAERGVSTVKVKIGGPRLDLILPILAAVRAVIGARALRLDANGSLDAATACDELALLSSVNPELVEEPVPRAALRGLTAPSVNLALDESLQDPAAFDELTPHLVRLRCVAVVLKPMALGGFSACLGLAERARAAELDVTVSHLFDGPVALAAAAHLALATASRDRASGLDAHGGLGAWPAVSLPALGPTSVVATDQSGLGLPPLPELG